MCYNNNWSIEIKTCIDGVSDTVSTRGKLISAPSGYSFDYNLDGDECTLCLTGDKVVQTRRGEQNIKITFQEGETTECILESGGFCGTITVFTEHLQHTVCSIDKRFGSVQIFTLTIVYTLGEQRVKIDFSAKYTSRVKK